MRKQAINKAARFNLARTTILLALPLLLLASIGCGAASVRDNVYDPDQPLYPVKGDDPFFFKKVADDEVFRVLVTDTNYQVRQVAAKKLIRRSRAPKIDLEKLAEFREFHDRYNFADQVLTAVLNVKLNPNSGRIQNIYFVPTENPQSWQVGRLMQHDLGRYQFRFPTGQVRLHTFRIRCMFKIKRDPTLSKEEARKKAIELISSERR